VTVENLFIFYIVYYALESSRHIRRLVDVIFLTSAVIALLGIFQYFTGGLPPIVKFLFDPEYQFYGRATSVFSSPNTLGHYLSSTLGIALVSLFLEKSSLKKRFGFILPVILLDSGAILLSFSRGSMVSVFFGILVIGSLYFTKLNRRKLSWQLLLIIGVLVAFVVLTVKYYDLYLRIRSSSYREKDSVAALAWIKNVSDSARKNAAIKSWQTFLRYPLFGIGYDAFSGKMIASGLSSDNQYLRILSEMGLLGFIPFVVLFGSIIKTGLSLLERTKNRRTDQIMTFMLLTAISIVACTFLFANTLHWRAISGNLWMFAGAIFVLDRQKPIPE
jgi:putative inorganic carbon (HCO3(-)) transporter